MIGYKEFSSLRLDQLFPGEFDNPTSYHFEYLGGFWAFDDVPGAKFWFPQCEGASVGMIELEWAKLQDEPAQNALRVLERIGLPLRPGCDADELRLLGEPDQTLRNNKAKMSQWYLTTGEREPYSLAAITCDDRGLISIEIRRPDLVERNNVGLAW